MVKTASFILRPVLYLTLLLPFSLSAQHRPKVGLVLSGGGAKGMAHIGVLKVLERAGLRPDYITGTSMGSVVGGLYAMGYSADQLETIVEAINWDEVLTNKVPLDEVAIAEKPYYNRYALELPVTKKFKVTFPGGIIEGEKLTQLLAGLTRPVHDVDDFNKLPIPFACVATDIATGQAVVLNKGNLAQCIRASMAIPTVFTPVEIDGKLLVDGGLVRNFPVQEAKDMGAEIIIGVFVSDDLKTKEELNGFVDILFQTSWVLSAYDTRKQKDMVDIYLAPDHKGYGTGDFKMSPVIIQQGEVEGEKFFARFERLADSLNAIAPQVPLVVPKAADHYEINTISVTGNNKIPASLIKAKFGLNEHESSTSKEIEKQVSVLFGTRQYTNVSYQLHKKDTGGYNLRLNVKEGPPGKLKTAIHYDTENKAGVNVNLTLRNVLLPASRALVEVDLAEFPRATLNYLKYVGKHQNFGAMANADYNSFEPKIQNGSGSDLYSVDQYTGTFTLFSTKYTNHTFGGSFSRNYIQLKPQISDGFTRNIDYIRNNAYSAQAFFQMNTLERPFFPRRGGKAVASVTSFFSNDLDVSLKTDSLGTLKSSTHVDNITRVDLDYEKIIPLHRSISLITDFRMAFSNQNSGSTLSILGTTYFGGFRPRVKDSYSFYGAHNYDYSASNFGMAKIDFQFQLSNNLYLTSGINYLDIGYPMRWFDKNYTLKGNLTDDQRWRLGYGLSLGYMSIIGPISFTMAMDSKQQQVLTNFNIGFYY